MPLPRAASHSSTMPERRRRDRVARRVNEALQHLRDVHVPAPSVSVSTVAPTVDDARADDDVVSSRDEMNASVAAPDVRAMRQALTCAITNAPFVEPVTTPCGHTFEREAIARWLTRAERERAQTRGRALGSISAPGTCPECRTPLYHELPYEWPVNTTVRACAEAAFGNGPERARRTAAERRNGRGREHEADVDAMTRDENETWRTPDGAVTLIGKTYALPMFFLDAMVPGQEVTLDVYEAKYKVLIRRALTGSRRFLMMTNDDVNEEKFYAYLEALESDDGEAALEALEVSPALEVGCEAMGVSLERFGRFCVECQIVTCQELVDGQFLVRIRAMRHVYVHSAVKDPSGFCVAKCTRVYDRKGDPYEDYLEPRETYAKLELRVARAMELFGIWLAMTSGPRWLYNYGGRMSTLLQAIGPRPPKNQPGDLGWWIVRALNPLPTIDGTIEMRSICLNAWDLNVRFNVISQMLVYSLALVQRIRVQSWIKREHAIAVSICDALFDVFNEIMACDREHADADDIESIGESLVRRLGLATLEPSGALTLDVCDIIRRGKGWTEDWTENDEIAAPEATEKDKLREVCENEGEYASIICRFGPGGLALCLWRALSRFECNDPELARLNALLLKRLGALEPIDEYAPSVPSDVDSLLLISSPFAATLRREMRCGVYKVLYLYDIARLLVYVSYRLLVLCIFALGFLFELIFDREFQGGRYTVVRGVIMATLIGAATGLYARRALISWIVDAGVRAN